jgi:hypothetical protein
LSGVDTDSAVSFRGVHLAYGSVRIIDDVSLEVASGRTTAIVGESGSGKSTLLQMINGLIRPDRGEVLTLGRRVEESDPIALRRRIGYAVQGSALFPHLDVETNVTLLARLEGWQPERRRARLEALMGGPVEFAQSHHNCIMTKYPGYSSATLWHQDIRYWSFDRPELVSTWLALGDENPANGSLQVIPGSHRLELDRGRLDAELFLRPELPENAELIATAVPVTLAAGDVLFFDAQTFHAAGTNTTDEVKLSAVFTYHRRDNRPIAGTRSANYPSLEMQGRRD